jgi:hypothetical protein
MKTVIISILFSLLTVSAFSQSAISGQSDSAGHVQLDWSMGKRMVVSMFTVQQSVDGANWISIATVRAAHPSSSVRYSYSSNAETGPAMWFRLQEEDSLGHRTYSNVIRINGATFNR